jgi:hypothetical protein
VRDERPAVTEPSEIAEGRFGELRTVVCALPDASPRPTFDACEYRSSGGGAQMSTHECWRERATGEAWAVELVDDDHEFLDPFDYTTDRAARMEDRRDAYDLDVCPRVQASPPRPRERSGRRPGRHVARRNGSGDN